jgi:hypothetical protein
MTRDSDNALNFARRFGGQAPSAPSPERAALQHPPGISPTEDVRAAIAHSIEAKTRRDVMDNKYMVLIAACIGAVAAIGGGLAVGMYQLSAEKERAKLELIRMAAGTPASAGQAVRNLQFWNRIGLISLPVSSKDFAQAACDCLNECPAPLKRAACDVKPAN